jgi:hypothetical protein
VSVLPAGKPGLQEEVGHLIEQGLQIDGIRKLGPKLRVGMPPHS